MRKLALARGVERRHGPSAHRFVEAASDSVAGRAAARALASRRSDLVVRVAKDRRGRIGARAHRSVRPRPARPQVESCVASPASPCRRSASRSPAKGRGRARRRATRRRSPSSSLVREVPSGDRARRPGQYAARRRVARGARVRGARGADGGGGAREVCRLRVRVVAEERGPPGLSRAWPRWRSRSAPPRRSTWPPTSSGSRSAAARICMEANASSRGRSKRACVRSGTRAGSRSRTGHASQRRSHGSRARREALRSSCRREGDTERCEPSPSRRSVWKTETGASSSG